MTDWINLSAVAKIVVFGLLVGAGLPALFAVGARLNAVGVGTVGERNPMLIALSRVVFAVVVVAVLIGVLFIARDFVAQHTGLYLLGAKHG